MPAPVEEVRKTKCATCPFRKDSPNAYLVPGLLESALTTASRICHSTGGRNAINPQGTGKPPLICRGARDEQLTVFHRLKVIDAPTDEAWAAAWVKMKTEKQPRRRANR